MRLRVAALTDECTLARRLAIASPATGLGSAALRTTDGGTMRLQSEFTHHAGLVDPDLLARRVHRLPLGFVPDAKLAARAGEDDVLEETGIVAQRGGHEQPALFIDDALLGTRQIEIVVEFQGRGRQIGPFRDARLELQPLGIRSAFEAAHVADAQVGHEQTVVAETLQHLPELHRNAHPALIVDSRFKCAAEHRLAPTNSPSSTTSSHFFPLRYSSGVRGCQQKCELGLVCHAVGSSGLGAGEYGVRRLAGALGWAAGWVR